MDLSVNIYCHTWQLSEVIHMKNWIMFEYLMYLLNSWSTNKSFCLPSCGHLPFTLVHLCLFRLIRGCQIWDYWLSLDTQSALTDLLCLPNGTWVLPGRGFLSYKCLVFQPFQWILGVWWVEGFLGGNPSVWWEVILVREHIYLGLHSLSPCEKAEQW